MANFMQYVQSKGSDPTATLHRIPLPNRPQEEVGGCLAMAYTVCAVSIGIGAPTTKMKNNRFK